jgi:uncharacterized protein (TIGR03118 family)
MKSPFRSAGSRILPFCVLTVMLSIVGCGGGGKTTQNQTFTQNQSVSNRFITANLVSDLPNVAQTTDGTLIDPWGTASTSSLGPFSISENGSGKAALLDGGGTSQGLVFNIASPSGPTGGSPTGQVYNSLGGFNTGALGFKLADGNPALFIFATEDGTIVARNGGTGTNAVVTVDRSAIPTQGNGAVYKGLANGSPPSSGSFLFATNFRAGAIDIFDKDFALVQWPGSFTDPNLPPGFAPFGIQNIGGDLYITYARQDARKHDDVAGTGSGLINEFHTNGAFVRRVATGAMAGGSVAALNSPWGVAVSPQLFGPFGSALLIGNHGDGTISAFDMRTGALIGQLMSLNSNVPLTIPGLWSVMFGASGISGSQGALYFTAGIGDPPDFQTNKGRHGLFGIVSLARTGT